MGTRSTTKFIKKRGRTQETLVTIYQQYDGYIEGVGHDLARFILSKKLVNGIPVGDEAKNCANGFGCLIAQYIAEKKQGAGNLYIDEFDDEQEYNYKVIFDEDKYFNAELGEPIIANDCITIEVGGFKGSPKELLEYKENEDV